MKDHYSYDRTTHLLKVADQIGSVSRTRHVEYLAIMSDGIYYKASVLSGNAFTKPLDLAEDHVCIGRPRERLRIFVPLFQVGEHGFSSDRTLVWLSRLARVVE
ncbi:MAG TPA: hypothetical protein VH640_16815 [Bryobacteraceae bacterium]